jgi:hypothetical protein
MRAASAVALAGDADARRQTHGAGGQANPANRIQMNAFN